MPRLDAKEVSDEVVFLAPPAVFRPGGSVTGARDDEEVEVFVGFDEGIDDLHCGGRIDVGIEFADDEEKLSFHAVGLGGVGGGFVVFPQWVAHPLFVPPDLVHGIVVATAVGDSDFVKIVVCNEGAHGVLSSGGASVNPNPAEVHPGTVFPCGFDPKNAVGEAGVTDVLPADVVEGFRAERGAHTVDLHHDESKFRDSVAA